MTDVFVVSIDIKDGVYDVIPRGCPGTSTGRWITSGDDCCISEIKLLDRWKQPGTETAFRR